MFGFAFAILFGCNTAWANNGIGPQASLASALLLPLGFFLLLLTGTINAIQADGKQVRIAGVLGLSFVLLIVMMGVSEAVLLFLPVVAFFWFRFTYWMAKYGFRQIKGQPPFEMKSPAFGGVKCLVAVLTIPAFGFYVTILAFSVAYTSVPFTVYRTGAAYVRNTWTWEECIKSKTGAYEPPKQTAGNDNSLICGDKKYSEEILNRNISDFWKIDFALEQDKKHYRVFLLNKNHHEHLPYSMFFPYHPQRIAFDEKGEVRISHSISHGWDQMNLLSKPAAEIEDFLLWEEFH